MPESLGRLFLVATPVGNLDDLSPRAREVLAAVALVAAEDTRRTGRLLAELGIKKPLVSLFEHNERARIPRILESLRGGADVAVVSDGGSVGISDPGYPLIRAAADAGITVSAIPGPCAAVLALQVSGLPTDRFLFVGFPPKKAGRRRRFLSEALAQRSTVVAYVPARDTADVLDDLCAVASAPPLVAAARELTKLHEEVLRGRADAVRDQIRAREEPGASAVWKGEVTLVFCGEADDAADDDELRDRLREALDSGLSRSAALREVRAATGVPRARLYELLEQMRAERSEDP